MAWRYRPRWLQTCGVNPNLLVLSEEPALPNIEIYTQPWCPYCSRAMNLLTEKGVAFQEIEAPSGTAARADSIRRSGGRTSVPQIFIDGVHVGGSDDLAALNRAGKLDQMLSV